MKKLLLIFYSFMLPVVTFGAGEDGTGSATLENPLKEGFETVPLLIAAILDVIVQIGSMLLVVFVVITGLKFVTAKGNAYKLEEAKQAFLWTMIGAAIVLGAFVISEAVQGTVNQLSN